jgi:heterodisulfide reductase subunit D
MPGVELFEMERNRMDAWCCGASGGGKHDYAIAVGKERVEEAIASTADALITACPVCVENFNEAKEAGKFKVTVLDIAELLCKALA